MNKRIVKNASWIVGCKIAQSVVNLIIGMITARYLGPSNYGLINYASSVVAFVLPVMQLGLSKTLVQELIENSSQEGKVLGTSLVVNLASGLFCTVAVDFYFIMAHPHEKMTIFVGLLYSISLIFQATEMIQYWFQAHLLSKYPSVASLAAYCVVALYKVYLLVNSKGVLWFALTSTIDYLLISVILLVIYRRMSDQKLSFSFALVKQMLSRSKHYIVSSMMVTVFGQTDRIMLKLMISESATGYYSAAINCINITAFVFIAIIDSYRPEILKLKNQLSDKYPVMLEQLYCVIAYLSLFQSVGMCLLAKPIVMLLYGEQFVSSVVALRIAVWYVTFSYFGSVRNIWILAENKQKYLWIINLSGASLNVLLNLVLIPTLGVSGAALASLITQLFTNVIIGYIIVPIRDNNQIMLNGLNPLKLLFVAKTLKRFIGNKGEMKK